MLTILFQDIFISLIKFGQQLDNKKKMSFIQHSHLFQSFFLFTNRRASFGASFSVWVAIFSVELLVPAQVQVVVAAHVHIHAVI